jgi:hypothetical protein
MTALTNCLNGPESHWALACQLAPSLGAALGEEIWRQPFYPPSQKATPVKAWTPSAIAYGVRTMNAKRVIRRSLGEGGYASADFAEGYGGATAVKPWGSTFQFCVLFRLKSVDPTPNGPDLRLLYYLFCVLFYILSLMTLPQRTGIPHCFWMLMARLQLPAVAGKFAV